MKYIIVLGDGMSDEPLDELDGMTPLEYAHTPKMDTLSKLGVVGTVQTIPEGMSPGSDTANLSVMGYDPRKYYSGRSPLEALSIGVKMKDTDVAIRCNIVTLSEDESEFSKKRIIDHSSGEISTEECAILLNAVRNELENDRYRFYVGTSYRHCLIWNKGEVFEMDKPHDVLGREIGSHLPKDEVMRSMMMKSYDVLVNHPINIERKKRGENPANCCWFWGAGIKPTLDSFTELTGRRGLVISAVDLLKGIAVGASMGTVDVNGATGGLETNYQGKVDAAIKGLVEDGYDFVYIHVEAPDEMGHQGSIEKKIKAIEYLDSKVIEPLCKELDATGEEYRLLVLPDHPTPVKIRTHTSDRVPFLLYDSRVDAKSSSNYNEREAMASRRHVEEGHEMIQILFSDGEYKI